MAKTRILYVEDEPFLAKIVKESLESRGFEVMMVHDGAKVMQAFHQQAPDICVLDVMLPNVDGFELGKKIRAENASIPIIFLTAKVQTEDLLSGFSSGGNDYIRKPFSVEELIVRINNLLKLTKAGKSQGNEQETILLGEYRFFPRKYELHHGKDIRKLSHREAQLLQILADHRNYSVKRTDMLNQVWGDDSFFNSRNLDVYIARLRDYLKADETVQIITLKGVGYHFRVGE
ncbi:MAG: response regulator transcription factor [Bacteroidia bacterium]|nr:response regulator transcription factor [Bacteroidia bacterium]